MTQKSTSFIVPILNSNDPELFSNLKCSYLGNVDYEGEEVWGNYLYLEMNSSSPERIIKNLREHAWYRDELDPSLESIMFVFKIPARIKETIIEPFLAGKYSEIDRAYVDKCFDHWLPNKTRTLNYKILTKSIELRKYWEELLDVELPKDAEVWTIPKREEEIYGYVTSESQLHIA